jgi:hypothetical protein
MAPIIYAFVLYPEDATCREQVLALYEIEARRYGTDPSAYEASELVRTLWNGIAKATGQRIAAGLTMLAFQYLFHSSNEPVSLYRATQLVEAAMCEAKKDGKVPITFVQYLRAAPDIKDVRVPSLRRDIERAYRNHEAVSHILAADLLATNSLLTMPVFERNFLMDSVLLNTASRLEQVMQAREARYFQNPWLVTPALSADIRECGEVEFGGGFIELIRLGDRGEAPKVSGEERS